MRLAFLVFNLAGSGGTSRSAISQANALAARGHDVELVSVTRSAAEPPSTTRTERTPRPASWARSATRAPITSADAAARACSPSTERRA